MLTLIAALLGPLLGATPASASPPGWKSGPPVVRSASATIGGTPASVADTSSEPEWLAEINRYREAAGLHVVTNQRAWDGGIKDALVYLEHTPARYETGRYASAHTENPASPYYSAAGAAEAGYSDLEMGQATGSLAAVDVWLRAPFHAIGMLRAQLTRVALAVDPAWRFAGLNVIQGIDDSLPTTNRPILFPGPGITTDLLTFGGESPDPTETCGWQNDTVGLPLIVMLPHPPSAALSASFSGPTGTESTANRELCVVDQHTYHTTDAVYGRIGASILSSDNAVILIPRSPLKIGTYSVTVRQRGRARIAWSFNTLPRA